MTQIELKLAVNDNGSDDAELLDAMRLLLMTRPGIGPWELTVNGRVYDSRSPARQDGR